MLQASGALKWPAVAHTLIDLARGMKYLHELEIIHGDIKAANCMLKSVHHTVSAVRFTAKLADLGLAQLRYNVVRRRQPALKSVCWSGLLVLEWGLARGLFVCFYMRLLQQLGGLRALVLGMLPGCAYVHLQSTPCAGPTVAAFPAALGLPHSCAHNRAGAPCCATSCFCNSPFLILLLTCSRQRRRSAR